MHAFELERPTSLDQAIARLPKESWDNSARLLAGGQDLLSELKEHLAAPERLIDISRLEGLDGLERTADRGLDIGALCTLDRLEDESSVPDSMAVLREAATSIASPQIRSTGTVGGNLNQRPRCWYFRNEAALCLKKGGGKCFAKDGHNKYNAILGGGPSYIVHPSDLAPALVALDARVELTGSTGTRSVDLVDYFTLPTEGEITTETVRAADEVLTAVRVPAPPAGTQSVYLKFKERGSYDFALSSVALALTLDGGRVTKARMALGGVAPKPWRCAAAEEALNGQLLSEVDPVAIAELALEGAAPLGDNAYKIPLTKGLVRRALDRWS